MLKIFNWKASAHPRDEHGRFIQNEGIVLHEGKIYNVAKLIDSTKKKKVYQQPISDFKESLNAPLFKEDHKRIKSIIKGSAFKYPILVADTKNTASGKIHVDGFHRIHAAKKKGLTHLPAIKVSKQDLAKARVKKVHILHASAIINDTLRGESAQIYDIGSIPANI